MSEELSIKRLWLEFLPLSVSDITMALGDPAITSTVAHLPNARENLAAIGAAKSIAVFFESPIIMLLHASNTLAVSKSSSRALWKFTLFATLLLTLSLAFIAAPPIFILIAQKLFGFDLFLAQKTSEVLLILSLWPSTIAWRRFYQGILIRRGLGDAVAKAGFGRIGFVCFILLIGFSSGMGGAKLGALALLTGILIEALLVILIARRVSVSKPLPEVQGNALPTSLKTVWQFYWPLANSMMVIWGGRALLLAVIARAVDGPLALAVWPAAWGLVTVVTNATRMVQQIVIRNRNVCSDALLFKFAATVGISFSTLLGLLSLTKFGQDLLIHFLGPDIELRNAVIPIIAICFAIPSLVAIQNAAQGMLMTEARTTRINISTYLSTAVLLFITGMGVSFQYLGALASAIGMLAAITVETTFLLAGIIGKRSTIQFSKA